MKRGGREGGKEGRKEEGRKDEVNNRKVKNRERGRSVGRHRIRIVKMTHRATYTVSI